MGPATYDPREYWLARGKVYKEQFRRDPEKQLQEAMLLNYLKDIASFETVLEVGCGFGRISDIILSNFPDVQEYVAADMSPDQLENARNYVTSDKILFIEADIQSLSIQKKHDLVISVDVLMHVFPKDIDQVMTKLVDVSRMHVVNVDYFEDSQPEQLASHNFMHQYEEIYKSLSSITSVTRVPIVKRRVFSLLDSRQSIFHATVAQ